jgi:hypothetical protein
MNKEQIIAAYKKPAASPTKIAFDLIEARNFPTWLINSKKSIIVFDPNIGKLEYFVYSDYLSAGDDNGFVYLPCNPKQLHAFMEQKNLLLPTTQMVKQIYAASEIKPPVITSRSLKNGSSKTSSPLNIPEHSEALQKYLANGKLTAGHKKDVVLTDNLLHKNYANNVAIFGWFTSDGEIIQKLNFVDHSIGYFDYSHGLRMVYNECLLNDKPSTLKEIFKDQRLCRLVHDAPLKFQAY